MRPFANEVSLLSERAEKVMPKPNSQRCQPSRLRVRRRERSSSSGGSDDGATLAKFSDHCWRIFWASSVSCFIYSSTSARVAGLASPAQYTGHKYKKNSLVKFFFLSSIVL